uniref:Non-specific serine/threonine protein kinase n=1 Tax=Panagrellus redivivus TaxID=6233 RepID=A0A7E4ZW97_PANRE
MSRRFLPNNSIYFTPPNNLPLTETEIEEEDGYTSGDESDLTTNVPSDVTTVSSTSCDDYGDASMSFESGETIVPNTRRRPLEKTYTVPTRLTQSAAKNRDLFDLNWEHFDPYTVSGTPSGSKFSKSDLYVPSDLRNSRSRSAIELYPKQQYAPAYEDDSEEELEESDDDSFARQLHIPVYRPYHSSSVVGAKKKQVIKYSSEQRSGTRSFVGDGSQMQFRPKRLNFDDTTSGLFDDTRNQPNTVDRSASTCSSATIVNKFKRSPASDASTCSVATNSLASRFKEVDFSASNSSTTSSGSTSTNKRSIECLSTQIRNSMNKAVNTQASNINCVLVEPVAIVSKQHVEMSSRSNRASIIYEIFIYSALQKSIHENPVEADKLLYEAKPAFSNSSELTNNGQVLAETKHSVRVGSGVIYIKRVTTVTEGMRDNKYRSTDVREYNQICKGGIKAAVQKANINALLNVSSDHDFTKDANGDISEIETISLVFGEKKDKNYRELEPFISSTCKDSSSQSPIFYDEHIQLGRQSVIIKRVTKLTGEKIAGAGLDKIWEKKVDFGITEDRYYQRSPESTMETDATSPRSGANVSTAKSPGTTMKSPSSLSVCSNASKMNNRRSCRMKDKSKLTPQPRVAQSCGGNSSKSSTTEKGVRERARAGSIARNDNTVDNVSSLCSISNSAESPKTNVVCIAKKCTNRGIHWYMRESEGGAQAKGQGGVRKRSASVEGPSSGALTSPRSSLPTGISVSNTSLAGTAISSASSNSNTDTASTVRSTATAIEPLASSTPSRRLLDANTIAQVRRTMTELSPIPLRNTQSDTVLTNAYTSKMTESIIRDNQEFRSTDVMRPVGANESELDQLKAVIEKSRKNKPPVSEKIAASGTILPPLNMDPQMLSCTVDITEPMTRVASMNHMFYHHRRVRLCFMANNVPMAVNLILTVRSDEQDLKLEPVEMFIDNERVWRRSVRIAAKKGGSKEPDSDIEKSKKDTSKLSKEDTATKLTTSAVSSASNTSAQPVTVTNATTSSSVPDTSAAVTSGSNTSVASASGTGNPTTK